jgi:prepilin-type N-terminal cleavage/methylation domain-containing protein/prepilin-type processing-associated H-X9-DG protein
MSRSRGFTLIELLVVIAIIAILAAILFPVFAKAREKARQTSCLNNQRQIAVSILMYAQDHDETLPDASNVWVELNVDRNILMCPTKGKKVTNAYVYMADLSGMALGDITDPPGEMMTADGQHAATSAAPATYDNCAYTIDDLDARHSNKYLASFADGHVQIVDPDKFSMLPNKGRVVGWYKADAVTSVADGSPIASWPDSGPNGNNFGPPELHPTDSNYWPTFRANRVNGYPAIRFGQAAGTRGRTLYCKTFKPNTALGDSVSYALVISGVAGANNGYNGSGAVYTTNFAPENGYNKDIGIGFWFDEGNDNSIYYSYFNSPNGGCHPATMISPVLPAGTFGVFSFTSNSPLGQNTMTQNGTLASSAITNVTAPKPIMLSQALLGSNHHDWELYYPNCEIAEFLIFSPSLSQLKMSQVEKYLELKYNL